MSRFERFLSAQDPILETVRAELDRGRRKSDWVPVVFPAIRGAVVCPQCEQFSLADRAEAAEYLAHPVLGARLQQHANLVLAAPARSAELLMGNPGHHALHASVTLFAQLTPPQSVFERVLVRYWSGERHAETVALLADG